MDAKTREQLEAEQARRAEAEFKVRRGKAPLSERLHGPLGPARNHAKDHSSGHVPEWATPAAVHPAGAPFALILFQQAAEWAFVPCLQCTTRTCDSPTAPVVFSLQVRPAPWVSACD